MCVFVKVLWEEANNKIRFIDLESSIKHYNRQIFRRMEQVLVGMWAGAIRV